MNSYGNADRLLSNVITEWLNNDSDKSWHKLAGALRYCNHSVMADKILQVRKRAVTKGNYQISISLNLRLGYIKLFLKNNHNLSIILAIYLMVEVWTW